MGNPIYDAADAVGSVHSKSTENPSVLSSGGAIGKQFNREYICRPIIFERREADGLVVVVQLMGILARLERRLGDLLRRMVLLESNSTPLGVVLLGQ